MKPVCTAAQTRALDHALITDLGMPSHTLMELAGHGAALAVHRRFPDGKVAIFCGPGNNGGDGAVIARWLRLWGRDVAIWALPPKTLDCETNLSLCAKMGMSAMSIEAVMSGAEVAVDALLGTGQVDAARGQIVDAIEAINSAPNKVSIDIPTGLNADTGQSLGPVVSADLTVTLGRWKPGLLASPGCVLAGEVAFVDIGLDLAHQSGLDLPQPDTHLLEEIDINRWRPRVRKQDAKWDRGHVGIIAGGGAATLAAHGAFRGGAGLVTLFAPKSTWESFHGLWPEVILATPDRLSARRHRVLVIGPGLGLDAVDTVLHPGPVVADADALTILSRHSHTTPCEYPRVITPHSAEAARLLGCERETVEASRFDTARALAADCVALLKGPNSLIASNEIWVNPTGSERLATAGTGDVLAGMIGGLLAAGLSPDRATAVAAWDHGAAASRMPVGGTASDLIAALQSD